MRDRGIVLSGSAETKGIGSMADARWEEFFNMAAGQGIYPKTLDYKRAYSLQFLPTGVK
jgi:NitT/TauT family transport system substrate-binding protein